MGRENCDFQPISRRPYRRNEDDDDDDDYDERHWLFVDGEQSAQTVRRHRRYDGNSSSSYSKSRQVNGNVMACPMHAHCLHVDTFYI